MTDIAKRAATDADLEAAPPQLVAEIQFCDLVTHPIVPSPAAAFATTAPRAAITQAVVKERMGRADQWMVMNQPELHPRPHVVVPDIAGWRRERMPQPPETEYSAPPPDWICEVQTPSTGKYDRRDRRSTYAPHGAEARWLVDAHAKSLETFARAGKAWLWRDAFFDTAEVCAPPFVAFGFSPGQPWPSELPPTQNA